MVRLVLGYETYSTRLPGECKEDVWLNVDCHVIESPNQQDGVWCLLPHCTKMKRNAGKVGKVYSQVQ